MGLRRNLRLVPLLVQLFSVQNHMLHCSFRTLPRKSHVNLHTNRNICYYYAVNNREALLFQALKGDRLFSLKIKVLAGKNSFCSGIKTQVDIICLCWRGTAPK